MPKIELSGLYEGMQKEMLQKLCTGADAVVHSGTKTARFCKKRDIGICNN